MPKRKFKVGDSTYEIPEEKVSAFKKKYSNAVEVESKLTPEEEAIRQQRASTFTEGAVTEEQYAELERLYNRAKESAKGDPNKKTDETLEFQRYYHSIPALKTVAEQIISEEKNPTNKGKTLPTGQKHDVIANEDGMFGKRTELYWQSVKKNPPAKPKLSPIVKKEVLPAERKPFERNPPKQLNLDKSYAPWWLQDIVKTTGAANDLMRIKKYQPWQAKPNVNLPDATFYDPTRELAANAEQANIQTQGLATFTGPQSLSARSSAIQGQAAKNVADIMAKYNNLNVGIANQLSGHRTDIMNNAEQNQANLDTQLWDKYTIANQQFDNAKNMARQNLRQSYIDAITNRAKTQALNTLYPNYKTDPSKGGFVQFNPGYGKIKPTTSQEDGDLDLVQKIIDRFPGTTPTEAFKIIKENRGSNRENTNDVDNNYSRYQGYQ